MSERLPAATVDDRAPDGWVREDGELVRRYPVEEYLRGVNFAQMVGEIAESRQHHPVLVIRHDEVEVRMTSHDAGGITEEDLAFADLLETEWSA